MKLKAKPVLLLFIAAVASTALVASAQTPAPAPYVITSTSDDAPAVAVVPPVPPQPPAPPGAFPSADVFAPRPDVFAPRPVPVRGARNQFFYSPDDGGPSRQAEALAQQLAAARSDSDRDKIKGQLTELLEKQFDQRQKRHEEEIKQLEAQVKKLKDLVDKRQENRREIISRRLDQIVKESQGLGW
jgi:hypothetical protein